MFYTIFEGSIIQAQNKEVLEKFYGNVLELPQDYEQGKYIVENGRLILNPNWEEEQAQKERERIEKLTCTKRVFALMLQEVGITYTQLKELIATNEQAQLEWELCVELQRGNPLLDVMAAELHITSEHLDLIFKFANKEVTEEEFKEQIQLLNKEVVEE